MAIFASFVHFLPNILHTWPHDDFQVIRLSMTLDIFQCHWTVSHRISQNGVWYGKSYYRQLIGNHTLAFDWSYFWWPWSTFEGHFSLGCHFHVHFSNLWHAFASHGLPAIAELLVVSRIVFSKLLHALLFHFISTNSVSIIHKPYSLNWCKFLINALHSSLNGMLRYWYFVTVTKIILHENCLQTPKVYLKLNVIYV